MTTRSVAQRAPALAAYLLAVLATAAFAHALIAALGTLGLSPDADAYGTHAHAAAAPVALAAVAVLAGLLLRVALRHSAASGGDALLDLAERLAHADLRVPFCAVAAGGFATLVGMEAVEQLAAFGHADLAAALGGAPLPGASIVVLTSLLVTVLGSRCARALADAAVAASRVVAALFVAGVRAGDASLALRRTVATHRVPAGVLLARRRPSRAPPPVLR